MQNNTPNVAPGVLRLFAAGFTGIDFNRIESVEMVNGQLSVNVGSYFDFGTEKFHTDFFDETSTTNDIFIRFEFPENGWDFLGKSDSPYGDGKALFEDFLNEDAMPADLHEMRALWAAERQIEHNVEEQKELLR